MRAGSLGIVECEKGSDRTEAILEKLAKSHAERERLCKKHGVKNIIFTKRLYETAKRRGLDDLVELIQEQRQLFREYDAACELERKG